MIDSSKQGCLEVKQRVASCDNVEPKPSDLAKFCKDYIALHGADSLAKLLGQAILQTGYKLDKSTITLNYDFGEVCVTCTPVCPSQLH